MKIWELKFSVYPLAAVFAFVAIVAVDRTEAVADTPLGFVTAREAKQEMADFARARLDNATEMTLVSPYYSLENGTDTRLVVLNKFVEGVELDVQFVDAEGTPYPPIHHFLQSRRQVELDLRGEMETLQDVPRTGSLRLSFLGDSEMLQAWVVVSKGSEVMGFPLTYEPVQPEEQWISSWDTRPYSPKEGIAPVYVLQNLDSKPAVFQISWDSTGGKNRRTTFVLPGNSTQRFSPLEAARSGSMRIEQTGASRRVVIAGFLEGPALLAQLPIANPRDLEGEQRFHSFALPVPEGLTDDTSVVLVNLLDVRKDRQGIGRGADIEVRLIALKSS